MIIIILLLIRRSSNYISTDAVADYHYTFVNPGYDIAGGGYTLVQAPGDVDKPADDLNTKIWTNPGSIGVSTSAQIYGVRKLLQIGGHGMVEYIIADTPPNQATTTNTIDKVTYNSIEYVIPDHIILKKSKISPVLFTCPPGQGTVTGDTCAVCTGSQWSNGTTPCANWTGPTSCPAGQGFTAGTASNDRSCAACTGIQYSLGGTNACANWTGPTSCPAGQGFTAGTASNDRRCTLCNSGATSAGGTAVCAFIPTTINATTTGSTIPTNLPSPSFATFTRPSSTSPIITCIFPAVSGRMYTFTVTGAGIIGKDGVSYSGASFSTSIIIGTSAKLFVVIGQTSTTNTNGAGGTFVFIDSTGTASAPTASMLFLAAGGAGNKANAPLDLTGNGGVALSYSAATGGADGGGGGGGAFPYKNGIGLTSLLTIGFADSSGRPIGGGGVGNGPNPGGGGGYSGGSVMAGGGSYVNGSDWYNTSSVSAGSAGNNNGSVVITATP